MITERISTFFHGCKFVPALGKKIILNFQASNAVFPGQEYVLYVSTLGLASSAPLLGLIMQAVGLALRLRVIDGRASAGDSESSWTRAVSVLSMYARTVGSRLSSPPRHPVANG
jgi:hypothetical protein